MGWRILTLGSMKRWHHDEAIGILNLKIKGNTLIYIQSLQYIQFLKFRVSFLVRYTVNKKCQLSKTRLWKSLLEYDYND